MVDATKSANADARRATLVIVHCRGYDDLSACLASLETWDETHDVIIIDHVSVARSLSAIAQRFPWARLVAEPGNPGFAAAVNRGVRASATPYVVVLNPDSVLHGPLREPLISYLESAPDVGVVGPRLLNADGSVQQSARRFPDVTTIIGGRRSWLTAVAPGNWFSRRNLLVGAADTSPKQVDWVSGACMMFRRAAFDQVDGLDESFFLYWEDADFCRRLARTGWRTMWHPGTSITHVGAGSSRFAPYAAQVSFHRGAYRYHQRYAGVVGRCAAPLVALTLALRLLTALTFNRARAGLGPLRSAPPVPDSDLQQGPL